MASNLLLDAALQYAAWGWRVVPLHTPSEFGCSCKKGLNCRSMGKHPRWGAKDLEHGALDGTTDPDLIRRWWNRWPDANIGICTGQASGIWALDVDGEEGENTLADAELPQTVQSVTGSGGRHILFAFTPGLENEVKFAPGLDVRTEGGLIVAEPSLHPSGRRYAWELSHHPEDVGLSEAPDWLIERVKKGQAPAAKSGAVSVEITEGSRNRRLFEDACAMRRRGFGQREILAALTITNEERVKPPLEIDELEDISRKASRYEPAEDPPKNGTHPPDAPTPSVVSVVSVVKDVTALTPQPPDELEPEALYGLPGAVLVTIGPHTESHPAALLGSFLAVGGCALGRGPHVYRDGARHAANEFCNLVGLSGVSRKGTATRRIDELFELCFAEDESPYYDNNTLYNNNYKYNKLTTCMGLGSGEALVSSLCEMQEEEGGLPDRRLVVKEEEFARVLKVMRREGSTLSENLRSAWDSGTLANRTKGKLLEVRDAHVSVLGHITEHELREELSSASLFNGFANRFLWFCTKRARSLPFGGGDPPLGPLVSQIHKVLEDARRPRRVEFDDQVKRMWAEGGLYELLIARPPGLLGAVTSRAEAHVTRTALQYAVWDGDAAIRVPHLLASLAVWDYNEKSCAYIFGTLTGSDYADQLDEWLREVYPGFLTRKEIRDFYQRNVKAGLIEEALLLLEKLGRAVRGKLPTAGRSAETWQHNPFTTYDRNDGNDRSPLLLARHLVSEWGF